MLNTEWLEVIKNWSRQDSRNGVSYSSNSGRVYNCDGWIIAGCWSELNCDGLHGEPCTCEETQTRVFDVSEGCTPMTSQFLTWVSFNMSKGSKICEVLCVTVFAEEERGKEWPKSMSNNKEEWIQSYVRGWDFLLLRSSRLWVKYCAQLCVFVLGWLVVFLSSTSLLHTYLYLNICWSGGIGGGKV